MYHGYQPRALPLSYGTMANPVGIEPTTVGFGDQLAKSLEHVGSIFGTPGKTRTCDLLLRRQLFYPLNYGGLVVPLGVEPKSDPYKESALTVELQDLF